MVQIGFIDLSSRKENAGRTSRLREIDRVVNAR